MKAKLYISFMTWITFFSTLITVLYVFLIHYGNILKAKTYTLCQTPFYVTTLDWGMHYKTIPSVLISDNHSLVNSFKFSPLGNNSTRLSKKKRETFAASRNQLHHSVTFYFTVLSEPSQDSSTMKKNISVLIFIIYICSININTFLRFYRNSHS